MVYFYKSKEARSRWRLLVCGEAVLSEKDKTVITDFEEDSVFEFEYPISGLELAYRGSGAGMFTSNPMFSTQEQKL